MSHDAFPSGSARARLEAVRARIRAAAARVGRDPEGVRLVAVSKTVSADRVLELASAGQRLFGENRVQEARAKIAAVGAAWTGEPLTFRLIGHLQRNKIRAAMEVFDGIDSVDSFRLLDALSVEGERRGRRIPVLLEFNCSGEGTKGGFAPDETGAVAEAAARAPGVLVTGLMTVARPAEDPEEARPDFRRLRGIREALEAAWGRELPDLSMGMSDDLEIAVEEGATLVRVGTALFGPRPAGPAP